MTPEAGPGGQTLNRAGPEAKKIARAHTRCHDRMRMRFDMTFSRRGACHTRYAWRSCRRVRRSVSALSDKGGTLLPEAGRG
jgi:hypothetical protein